MFIDTHTHLYLEEFDNDGREAAVDRAIEAGVTQMIFPNVDVSTIEPMKKLHAARPDSTFMAMGLHPTEVNQDWREALGVTSGELLSAEAGQYVAVGEIGMDLYWDRSFVDEQMQVFEKQCSDALKLNLPVIIHCREALDHTLEVVSEFPGLRGVMHSFGGTPADVERILATNENLMFGIGGVVTFKNARVRESLQAITLNRLLLETDAPYLAPVPFRGKRCESAMLPYTARHIAEHMGVDIDLIARRTTDNARRLFPLPF